MNSRGLDHRLGAYLPEAFKESMVYLRNLKKRHGSIVVFNRLALDEESSQLVWSVIIEKVRRKKKTAMVVNHSEKEAYNQEGIRNLTGVAEEMSANVDQIRNSMKEILLKTA